MKSLKGGSNQRSSGLGSSLLKNKYKSRGIRVGKGTDDLVFAAEDVEMAKGSVTEISSLDDFLLSAQMSEISFVTERSFKLADASKEPHKIIRPESINDTKHLDHVGLDHLKDPESMTDDKDINGDNLFLRNNLNSGREMLRIPRRPSWTRNMDAKELHKQENVSFISWRRELARFQESNSQVVMTPYELNLNMWRQLWRVIERSEMVIQIVDARNPLLFKCADLETFVQEEAFSRNESIPLFLLLNKADLLNETQRSVWANYFTTIGTECIFYSANGHALDADCSSASSQKSSIGSFINENCSLINNHSQGNDSLSSDDVKNLSVSKTLKAKTSANLRSMTNSTHIFSPKELLVLMEEISIQEMDQGKDTFNVGLVGYPNVGKSSTINSILNAKRVRVGATPGKTKHLQTIFVDDFSFSKQVCDISSEQSDSSASFSTHIRERTLCLVDCPGLIFPNFATTRAELVVNGILPIDQMKDFIAPCDLVAYRIPKPILQSIYGWFPTIKEGELSTRPPSGRELISAFIRSRGMSESESSRVARTILKDYVAGTKICYVHPPPGYPEFIVEVDCYLDESNPNLSTASKDHTFAISRSTSSVSLSGEMDTQYSKTSLVAHTKGKFASTGYTRRLDFSGSNITTADALSVSASKRHYKKNPI